MDLEEKAFLSTGDIKRLFPDPKISIFSNHKYDHIEMTQESVTSVTPFKVANLITHKLKLIFYENYNFIPVSIVDASANVGGNCISFATEFAHVTAIELKEKTMRMLQSNLNLYGITNVHTVCGDFNRLIKDMSIETNVVFIDPPWYIERQLNSNLILDFKWSKYPITIDETIIRIWGVSRNIMIAIKVPKKYITRIIPSITVQYKKMDILVFIY